MDGADAVRLARRAVEAEVRGTGRPDPTDHSEPSGVFVTLSEHPSGRLRGCIGFPMPVLPLEKAVCEAARSACHDPRFPDLSVDELDSVTVEVTVLTVPEPLSGSPDGIRDSIVVGRDGLILELLGHRGLLLPQVPTEQGWDAEQFLEALSSKAGLPQDAWRHPDARIQVFRGDVFHETSPRGEIRRSG